MKVLMGLLVLVSSVTAFAQQVEFKWNEEEVKSIELKDFQKGSLLINGKKIVSKQEKIYNPFRKYHKSYEGYDFVELMDQVYGVEWRKADSIRFMAIDGFTQVSPIKKMLEKAQEHKGIIAYKEVERESFESFEKNGKVIDPGPFYLVWTKFEGRAVANYADHLKWPYQLKSIVVVGKKK